MNRLLIIEDDPHTLSGLLEILDDEGYDVQGVGKGQEALKIAETDMVDIVLCDYSLPDFDGIEVCTKLKKLQPGLIFLLVTAYYNKKVFGAAYKNGVTEVFTKPIIIDDLLNKLTVYAK